MVARRFPGVRFQFPFRKSIWPFLLLSFLAACGLKGPLQPPRQPLPAAPAGFSVQQKGDQFLLSWSIPHKNQDGSSLTDLAGFRVFKMRYDPAKDCPECRDTSVLFREVDLDYLREATRIGDRLFLWDTDLDVGFGYRYRVVPLTRSGFDGAAAVAKRVFLTPPPAPTGLAATALDHLVRLVWKPIEKAPQGTPVGYNVYRRTGERPFPPNPLNSEPLKVSRFEDFSALNDTAYHYAVRSVALVPKQELESALSGAVAAVPSRGH